MMFGPYFNNNVMIILIILIVISITIPWINKHYLNIKIPTFYRGVTECCSTVRTYKSKSMEK